MALVGARGLVTDLVLGIDLDSLVEQLAYGVAITSLGGRV